MISLFKPAVPTSSAEPAPRYFEAMGEALGEVNFLRHLSIGLSGLCFLLMLTLARSITRAPLVIRVDELNGAAAVRDLDADAAANSAEVRNFTRHFARELMGWDLYSLDDDLNRALAMMTPEASARMKRHLDELNVAQAVRADSLRTKVVVQEISVDKDTAHSVALKVRGSRISESYEKKSFRKETIFEDTLVVRKVARSEATPWGLLVEDWSEHIFKESANQ